MKEFFTKVSFFYEPKPPETYSKSNIYASVTLIINVFFLFDVFDPTSHRGFIPCILYQLCFYDEKKQKF